MDKFSQPLERLIEEFEALPGIGHKSASRLAYYILSCPIEKIQRFANTLIETKTKIRRCDVCQCLTDLEVCPICSDNTRDNKTICVVEDPKDISSFEKGQEYSGQYHVLHGLISPLSGIGPEDLTVKELLARVDKLQVSEVIMATNPTIEGDATAMYIAKLLKPLNVKVTRLAYGMPVGGDLEYADYVTLMRAIEGRREM